MAGGLGGGLEAGQTSVAPNKGTATGGDSRTRLSFLEISYASTASASLAVKSTPEQRVRRRGRMR